MGCLWRRLQRPWVSSPIRQELTCALSFRRRGCAGKQSWCACSSIAWHGWGTDGPSRGRIKKDPQSGSFKVGSCLFPAVMKQATKNRCLQMPPVRHPEPEVQVGKSNLSLGSSDARRSRSIGDVSSPCSMSIGSRKYKNRQICRRSHFNVCSGALCTQMPLSHSGEALKEGGCLTLGLRPA